MNKYVYDKVGGDKIIVLCLYVDDIMIFGFCLDIIVSAKAFFANNFKMSDLDVVNMTWVVKLGRTHDGLSLSQSHYIEKILKR